MTAPSKPRTIYEKIFDSHLISEEEDGTCLIYIDRHLVHEVTSPQAFEGLRMAGRPVRRTDCTLATVDHNIPTENRKNYKDTASFVQESDSRLQCVTLEQNVKEFGLTFFGLADSRQGIVHVIGPEQGFTVPGATLVCGDSHTSTHGAFGALVLMPRFDAEEFLALIERERIDTIFMVPTMFIRLMKLPEEVRKKYDMSSLRHIIHAAAPCPADVKRAMIEWWGPVIYEFYGSTESGAVTFATSEDALKKPGTVGKISPGAELRFIGDDGKEVPQGQIGEIYSRIAGNPDFTYHNKSEKRAEIDREGFITSGDVGYIDADGYVFICDRKRDMVISGGVNIYPAEIENTLIGMDGVRDCAVFGVPDDEYGERLFACVEPEAGAALSAAAIQDFLRGKLANFKVPRDIRFMDALPREATGKIFKRKLRDLYREGQLR